MATWRVGAGLSAATGNEFFDRCVKRDIDPEIQRCLGDTAFINGKRIAGKFSRSAVAAFGGHQKSIDTEMVTFCYPDCDCPWVSCDMPFEFGGVTYRIDRIVPSRWYGWSCLYLKACKPESPDKKIGVDPFDERQRILRMRT